MEKVLKYIKYFIFFLLSIIIIGVLIFVLKSKDLFKYNSAIILSGSMEPILSIDDLVFTKKTEEIKVGDIVAFYDENGKRVMHRVVEMKDDNIITKGDANNTLDKSITKNQIEGVYVGKIKYVGKIIKFIKSPLGLLTSFLLITLILFFPSIKKEIKNYCSEGGTLQKNKILKLIFIGIIYLMLLSGCVIAGYYSKYQKSMSGNDSATVASWNNNIELLNNDPLHFQNGKNDVNIINFNLIYESEVSAYYSISVDNVINKLGIELSNDETTLSIKKANNNFNVSFNTNIETFDISTLCTNHLVVSNNIEATYELDGSSDIYTFKDKTSDKIIKIIGNGDNYNLDFINFGKFMVNDSSTKTFALKISTIEAELPNLNNLELYATFEQID